MSEVDLDAVLSSLKPFQRAAVNHVIDRFYGAESSGGTGRFLIADETGLGKSIVARGVVARTVDHLRRHGIRTVTIIYVCSNQDLARQNLRRLNVTGHREREVTTRLTLLSRRDREAEIDAGGAVTLISLTPGTSFDKGFRMGKAEERALLAYLLEQFAPPDGGQMRAGRDVLQGRVRETRTFDTYIDDVVRDRAAPDPTIVEAFRRRVQAGGELAEYVALREEYAENPDGREVLRDRTQNCIAALRTALAHAGADSLDPDLVILDEFQRFRDLLDRHSGEAGELAHVLFEREQAKVLLLSATPYKPFTNPGDSRGSEDCRAKIDRSAS